MKNPNGPYPGRQLFLGQTGKEQPAFTYLVTGRSPQSRERKATPKENSVIMGPTGNAPYDPLRHYTAVKYDNASGAMAVSNGIQTEAIYEAYKLIYNVKTAPDKSLMKKLMEGANFEPDSLKTPRISGVITTSFKNIPVCIISIKTADMPAVAWQFKPKAGVLNGISTYHGNMEQPGAYAIVSGLAELKMDAKTPQELADFIFQISAATYQGEDIRVCAISGIRIDNNWKIALINRHKE